MNPDPIRTHDECINCQSSNALVAGQKDGKSNKPLLTVACAQCGLVRVDPMPNHEFLRAYYQTEYRSDYKKIITPKFKHVWRAAHLAKERMNYFRPWLFGAKTSLDIGSGGGEFVGVSKAQGIQAKGIEPNEGYARFSQQEYGLEILNLSIEGFLEKSNETFDFISCFHVLEHLPDPVDSLRKMAHRLEPEGHLLLEVPNILYRYAAPGNTFFQAHIYHFSPTTLKAVIHKAGLKCLQIQAVDEERVIRAVISKDFDQSIVCPSIDNSNAQEAMSVVSIHQPQSWLHYYRSGKILQKFNHRFDRLISESFLALRFKSRQLMLEKIAHDNSKGTDSLGRSVRWFLLGFLFCKLVT